MANNRHFNSFTHLIKNIYTVYLQYGFSKVFLTVADMPEMLVLPPE